MNIRDQAIDEAEELAKNRILYDPTDEQILDAVREIIGVDFHSKSTLALITLGAYNRMEKMRESAAQNLERAWAMSR